MPRRNIRLAAAFVVLIGGCNFEEIRDEFIPQEEAEFAKRHLALYPARDFDEIFSQLNPQLVNDDTRTALEEIASNFPKEEPVDVLVVGSNTMTSPNAWSANLTFQYQFPDTYLVAVVALVKVDGRLMINGVNIQLLESSLEEINKFKPGGRGAFGYVFLILAVSIPIFIITSFVACIRTPIPKWKWAWAIFVLMGMGVMRLNWTTGEFGYSLLSWQLLGAGFVKPLYGPLILSIAAPIGASVFWARRKEWLLNAQGNET
jgi:hypothetical protein